MSKSPPSVIIVSGAAGTSGDQLVRTVLAQFSRHAQVIMVPHVRSALDLELALARAVECGGLIAHTLVDPTLRRLMGEMAQARGVPAIDLMGPLLDELARLLGEEPAGKPGLYRQQREPYFERIAAIEFSVAHDDGMHIEDLGLAELVFVGVSRTGKTPLSMYMAVQGWRVANVPLIGGMPPPPKLSAVDRRRVVGLTVEPGQLIAYRHWRQSRLGAGSVTAYTDPAAIYGEVEEAAEYCRRSGFALIDVTDKPIESSAEEVTTIVTRRLRGSPIRF